MALGFFCLVSDLLTYLVFEFSLECNRRRLTQRRLFSSITTGCEAICSKVVRVYPIQNDYSKVNDRFAG